MYMHCATLRCDALRCAAMRCAALRQGEELTGWRGCLLLQGLLFIGSRVAQLSGTVGLLDKYSAALHAVAVTDRQQQVRSRSTIAASNRMAVIQRLLFAMI